MLDGLSVGVRGRLLWRADVEVGDKERNLRLYEHRGLDPILRYNLWVVFPNRNRMV